MILDFTKLESLQRRDGGEFRIYATDHQGDSAVVGAIKDQDAWYLQTWNRHGRATLDCANDYDLITKPLRLTGWLNCYEMDGFTRPRFGDSVFSTKEEASRGKMSTYKCLGQVYIDSEIQT